MKTITKSLGSDMKIKENIRKSDLSVNFSTDAIIAVRLARAQYS